jgi:hypothetical protein
MENKERIAIDIEKLNKNLNELKNLNLNEKEKEVVESAINYREDGKYYLKKKEYFTAIDAIAYAHGLIDSLRIIYNLIK